LNKKTDFKKLLQEILEHASSNPMQIAIIDKWKTWTWDDIMSKTSNYIESIKKQSKSENFNALPILVGRSGNSIAAMLSCMLMGIPFSPLNYKQPSNRLKKIQKSLNAPFFISGLDPLESFSNDELNLIFPIKSNKPNKIESDFSKDKLLYILFTSGSTGEPKGVLCSSGNILNYLNWSSKTIDWKHDDVIGCGTQFSFDLSMSDIFYMLSSKISLVIFPEPGNPQDVFERIVANSITHIFSVPSFFSQFIHTNLLKNISKTKLRRIMSAGGFFPPSHMLEWFQTFPNLSIYNSWGPSETTIINSIHKISENDIEILEKGNHPSIGKPSSMMPFFLLNANNEKIDQINETGEIVVLGDSVTLGYLENSQENDQKYTTYENKNAFHTGDLAFQDSDQNFFMVGRKDSTVKIFGYRVDLHEIEKVLAKLDTVYSSLAFIETLNESNEELWVAIEVKNSNFSIFSTKKFLREQLPHYMVPKRIFVLPKIPLNENGKPDIAKTKIQISKKLPKN